MTDQIESYDIAIIGMGPAGIIAAHELCPTSAGLLLVDRLDRIGGAAFATDVNLQNLNGFPPQSDFGARTLGSRDMAEALVRESYDILHGYGLPYKQPDPVDPYSYAVDQPTLQGVLANFLREVEPHNNVAFSLGTELRAIAPGAGRRWRLHLVDAAGSREVEADSVLLATGKLSVSWLIGQLEARGIGYSNNPSLALGFRIEGRAEDVNPASEGRENFKIRVRDDDGVVTETFCWCKNGGVIAYDFEGAQLLDGEHFYGRPQENSSFGSITAIDLPGSASNTAASIAFAQFIGALGEGHPLVQRYGDFLANRATTEPGIVANSVQPSLAEYRVCNLRTYYPGVAVEGLLRLIDAISQRHPRAINADSLIYAPILERIFPDIALSQRLETEREGLFLIGDCSGKGVGVAPAFVMGLAAAREIAGRFERARV